VRGARESSFADPDLSTREREILQLVAKGHSLREIARRLHIAASTVGIHRRNMMRKLNVNSGAELTEYAIRAGMTSLD
jgi:two-component system NarL family response regulator